jgi:hypothetical protein
MTLSRFVRVFNSLPISERDMACCIIDGDGISWRLAYEEIKNKTELGQIIQAQLESLKFI